MTYRIGVLMDPIDSIKPKKDSTLAMMLAAQDRGWHVSVFTQADLYIEDGEVSVFVSDVTLFDDSDKWFDVLD
ncbi:MAG: glutathione synthase, partial [bacterium]